LRNGAAGEFDRMAVDRHIEDATDPDTVRLRHSHDHGPPHHHGGAKGPTRAATGGARPGRVAPGSAPGLSLLRFSIQIRLVAAIAFSAVIWVAIHWATA
jgi:hypothetical protein